MDKPSIILQTAPAGSEQTGDIGLSKGISGHVRELRVWVNDFGGGSIKGSGIVFTCVGNSQLSLVPEIKVGVQCRVGGNAGPNEQKPTLRPEGIKLAKEKAIKELKEKRNKFCPNLECSVLTEPFRAVFTLGSDDEIGSAKDLIEYSSAELDTPTKNFFVLPEEEEAKLAAEAAVLAGFRNGIVVMAGGNSIEIVHLKDGKIVDAHWSVMRIGSNSLHGRNDVVEIVEKELDDIPWLNDALAETNKVIFLGGTCRIWGRLSAEHFLGHDPLDVRMPYGGPFSWEKKSGFRSYFTTLGDETRNSLFHKKFGRLESDIRSELKKDRTYICGRDEDGRPKKVPLRKNACEKILETWDRKIGLRADVLPYTVPMATTLLDRHHRIKGEPIEVRMGSISIREAVAVRLILSLSRPTHSPLARLEI
jgi:hypothetical protein